MNDRPTLPSSPHLRGTLDTKSLMYGVVVALAPAAAGSVYFFGVRALAVIALGAVSAVVAEAACQGAFRARITVADGSALVTGMLLALTLPPGVPYWLPVAGSVFAIAIVKLPFGGLGYNLFNPALAARAFLFLAWPVHMTSWIAPSRGSLSGFDAMTEATPLGVYRFAHGVLSDPASVEQDVSLASACVRDMSSPAGLRNLLVGNRGGSLGETSVILLAVGAFYLLARRIISWRIPVTYLGTVALVTWVWGGERAFQGLPLFHLMAGGVVLGACFMATDIVTTPVSAGGKIVFGVGCGLLTSVIRLWGGYPEGVSYSILIMNATVPLIDRLTRPRILGQPKAVRW